MAGTERARTLKRGAIWFVSAFAALWLIVDASAHARERLNEHTLLELPIGSVERVVDLLDHPPRKICALHPYQQQLHDGTSDSLTVNAYLESIQYSGDEGHWALVLIDDKSTDLVTISRSRLDLLSPYETNDWAPENLPSGFTPTVCATGSAAALTKINFRNRAYLLLGQSE